MTEISGTHGNASTSRLDLVATHSSVDGVYPSRSSPDSQPTNFFKSAQWSADGTCVITNDANGTIQTFVIPPELLQDRTDPLRLKPYSQITSHEPVDAVTGYPGFDLQDIASTLVLSAVNEHPIRLNSVLTSELVASYPLIHHTTEAFIKPNSLVFTSDGTHFIAGSDRLISIFDLSRPGQEPTSSVSTGPKSSNGTWSNPGTSMRGIVSSLAIDRQYNVLAAGTLTRHIGLYDTAGLGECVGVFAVQDTDADKACGGRGITQLLWSPCGRYLYVAERKSGGIMMYDIRKTGQLLGWLEGRCGDTNQRLQIDVAVETGVEAHTIWAGGTDGCVRAWRKPYLTEGPVAHDFERRVHTDVVNASVIHPSGCVLATSSGQRCFASEPMCSRDDRLHQGSSLSLWSVT